ncbi:hypothetical protein UFOVP708_11 [uncultured Caudovirales phage]|uniref:Uncharacterized protein n=1 Tax=uncultured Caudovirales phage TaxID=2100421 RepID=A0A6J5NNL6_9CAUD|nr:hypothetical protein UFOVP708_11 [uncultured Caudovirales phage]
MKAVLTRANTVASFAIRARVWQSWSHGVIVDSPTYAVDSTFKLNGVRRRPLHEALHGATATRFLHLPLDREAEARDFYLGQINTDYDLHCIVGFATGDRDWRDDTSWFCWELIAAAVERGSDYRFDNLSRVTPRDLIRAERVLIGLPA